MPDRDPDLTPLCDADPLARALAKLRPAPAGVDPLRVTFLAGQATAAARAAFWRRLFLAQTVVLVVVGGLAVVQSTWMFAWVGEVQRLEGMTPLPAQRTARPGEPEPAPMPRPVPDPYPVEPELFAQPVPVPATDVDELAEYLRVRREVLTAGLGLLPESKARPLPPVSPAELERSLQLPRGVLTAPYQFATPPRPRAAPVPDPEPGIPD